MSSRFIERNVAPLHVLHSTGQRAVSFIGLSAPVLGSYQTEVIFDKTVVPVDFEVVKDIKYDAMLGRDFLDKNIKYINTRNGAIKFNDVSVVTILRKNVELTGRQSSAANSEAVRFNTLRLHLQHRWFRSRYSAACQLAKVAALYLTHMFFRGTLYSFSDIPCVRFARSIVALAFVKGGRV